MHPDAEVLSTNLHVDLLKAGWDEYQDNFPGRDPKQIAMSSLAKSLVKKFHNDEKSKARDDAALQLFMSCNTKCNAFTSLLPGRLDEEYCIGEMKTLLYDFFNPQFWGEDSRSCREPVLLNAVDVARGLSWGPGSNIGVRSTDFYSKSACSSMSSTSELLVKYFQRDLSVRSPLWADAERLRFTRRGCEQVEGSKLSFVPKSVKISRVICTEPLLNMLYQQGIRHVLERRLREVFRIDFSRQPLLNAKLARIGSETGEFGTIDLSSASDTISLNLCKEVIPPESFKWLMLTRSPKTTLPGGQVEELHMISSMGNGYTFPLQTTIFACLVAAAYKLHGIPLIKPSLATTGNFAVFGDDIIVDRRVYSLMTRCLEVLGFMVNRDKSFNEGLFRESCGSDWYAGHNVRGVYVERARSDGDCYSAINRLNVWSATHGVPLVNTVGCLLRGRRFIGVPFDETDDAGIKVPLSLARPRGRDIHGTYRYMALCVSPRVVKLPALGCEPGDLSLANSGRCRSYERKLIRVKKFLPEFTYCSDGLLLSLVAGYLRGGSLTLRMQVKHYSLVEKSCPGWDRFPLRRPSEAAFGERWKALTATNLCKVVVNSD